MYYKTVFQNQTQKRSGNHAAVTVRLLDFGLLGLWVCNIGEKKENFDDSYSHREFLPEPSQPVFSLISAALVTKKGEVKLFGSIELCYGLFLSIITMTAVAMTIARIMPIVAGRK
jgi:hypothetical protein